jgi:hypothetical protein
MKHLLNFFIFFYLVAPLIAVAMIIPTRRWPSWTRFIAKYAGGFLRQKPYALAKLDAIFIKDEAPKKRIYNNRDPALVTGWELGDGLGGDMFYAWPTREAYNEYQKLINMTSPAEAKKQRTFMLGSFGLDADMDEAILYGTYTQIRDNGYVKEAYGELAAKASRPVSADALQSDSLVSNERYPYPNEELYPDGICNACDDLDEEIFDYGYFLETEEGVWYELYVTDEYHNTRPNLLVSEAGLSLEENFHGMTLEYYADFKQITFIEPYGEQTNTFAALWKLLKAN